jgi:integrase
VADRFLRQHAAKLRPTTEREYRRILEGAKNKRGWDGLVARWGEKKASDITRADVIALLDEIALEREAPTQANRVRALVSVLFAWAVERDIVIANPATSLPRRRKERGRDRVLSDSEIKRLWKALDAERPVMASLFRFLVLTGQRSSETRGVRWDEIDGDTWTIPGTRTKNHRTHRVALSPQAQTLLAEIGKVTGADEYVFQSNRGGGPIKWVSHAGARIAERAKIENFRPHDIRRTVASGMAGLGVDRTTLQKILNHSDGASVTALYDRYARWPEQVEAMRLWGQHVEEITTEEPEVATTTRAAGGNK